MIAGKFAFQGLSEYLTWQKIKSLDYSFPDGFDEDAKDFVSSLLVRFIFPSISESHNPSFFPHLGSRPDPTARRFPNTVFSVASPCPPFSCFH